jgi:chloramphenicol O-acetyltransferase type A
MYTVIDLANWPRRAAFEFFKNYDDPFFNITGPVDVTTLQRKCKAEGSSFFLNSLYCATQAANAIPAFQLRVLDGQLVRYATIHVGSTVLLPDNTFQFCYFNFVPDRLEFVRTGEQRIEQLKQNPQLDPRDEALDMIHTSIIPWVSFTGFKHARRWGVADTIPKIVLGKYYKQNDRLLMPLSVEVNHAMMDGYHVGQYFACIQEIFNAV